MNILFIGDVVGRPGREIVRRWLPALVERHAVDLVIVNVENSAAGFGITREICEDFLKWGVHVMTSGNHIWDKKEALDYIGIEPRLLRPANYPAGAPGRGSYLVRTRDNVSVGVVNLMGRVFMLNIDDPFAVVLKEIEELKQRARIVFVDFHAEATSEKIAMGWHLDGKVTAVVGTHTHVPTADGRILPGGTAYITDVGMTGPRGGVIGVKKEQAIESLRTHMSVRFETSPDDPWLNGVVIRASQSLRADRIEQVLAPWTPSIATISGP
jgi:metallophosphoesterase (TIGR00282 family)